MGKRKSTAHLDSIQVQELHHATIVYLVPIIQGMVILSVNHAPLDSIQVQQLPQGARNAI